MPRRPNTKYPWHEMEPGRAVFLPCHDPTSAARIRSASSMRARHWGERYTVRYLPDRQQAMIVRIS